MSTITQQDKKEGDPLGAAGDRETTEELREGLLVEGDDEDDGYAGWLESREGEGVAPGGGGGSRSGASRTAPPESATMAPLTAEEPGEPLSDGEEDSSELEMPSEVLCDFLGFDVPPELEQGYNNYRAEAAPVLEERERSWSMLVEADIVHKPDKLQREIRRGVAHSHRREVWLEIAEAKAQRDGSGALYSQLVHQIDEVSVIPRTKPPPIYTVKHTDPMSML